jgi:hypothetical protein
LQVAREACSTPVPRIYCAESSPNNGFLSPFFPLRKTTNYLNPNYQAAAGERFMVEALKKELDIFLGRCTQGRFEFDDMNTASKLGPHTQTDRGTCPGVGL